MTRVVALLSALAFCVPVSGTFAQTPTAKPQATKPPSPAKPAAAVSSARPQAARPATTHTTRPGRPAWRPAAQPRQAYVPPPPVIDIDPAAVLPSDLPTVLSSSDVERYQRIVASQAGGNWAAADADIRELKDKTLLGYMLAHRYLQATYKPTQDELASWLREYNDHPDAPAVYRLAASRGGAGLTPSSFVGVARNHAIAPDTHTLGGGTVQAETVRSRLARMIEDRGFDAARRLLASAQGVLPADEVARWQSEIANRQLQSGNVDHPVGEFVDDRPSATWAAGIAAFRKGSYAEAARRFEQVADTPPDRAYSAVISAGAFWAARSNLLAGNPERFSLWMKRAAIYDRTFYGLLALKTLGVDLKPLWKPAELDRDRRRLLTDNSAAGRRGLALLQIRAITNAETEFFAAAVDADPRTIEAVLAIAEKARLPALALRVGNSARERPERIEGLDNAIYPLPPYTPKEGFVVEPALVYGFMRQESAFNPRARSYVGAMGLMQLMPGTATVVVRQFLPDRAGTNPYDPSFNVSMGQQYIRSLLGGDGYSNDLIKTVAAYNAGPGNVNRWMVSDTANDPLLFAASIPLNETRAFVEAVISNYWIYQLRMGKPTPTLDQLAQHQWPRYEGK